MNVYSIFIHNRQTLETTQTVLQQMNGVENKQTRNVVHPYQGILLSPTQGQPTDGAATCLNLQRITRSLKNQIPERFMM